MRRLSKSVPGAPGVSMRLQGTASRSMRGIRRLIKVDPSKGITQPEADRLYALGAQASLTTACAGANNDLVFTAKAIGNAGNNIRVRYVVAGNGTALSVTVSVLDITVNVATDGGGVATSTATLVKAAVDAAPAAAALVSTALKNGDTGAGVVAAFAFTNLTGGSDATDISGALGDGTQSARTLVKGRTAASGSGVKNVSPPNASKGLRSR